jgi:hypothetical protein
VANSLFANWHFIAPKGVMLLAVIAGGIGFLSDAAPAQSQGRTLTSDGLGASARQAMIDIFREKDPTVVDRYFGVSFIQHDPT